MPGAFTSSRRGAAANVCDTTSPESRGASHRVQQTIVQFQDPVHLRRDAVVVRDDNQTGAEIPIELEHQLHDPLGRVTIEVAGRLVGQQTSRPRDQATGECRPLTLTA